MWMCELMAVIALSCLLLMSIVSEVKKRFPYMPLT